MTRSLVRTALLAVPLALALALALAATACTRPSEPTIASQSVQVTGATPGGLGLRIQLALHNPNSVDLHARSVSARASVQGQQVGTTEIPNGITLGANQDTPLAVDMVLPWTDLPGLLNNTAAMENVPVHVDGTARVGVRSFTFDVPFQGDTAIPRSQLMGAATGGMPMPGMQLPNGMPGMQMPGMPQGGYPMPGMPQQP